MTGWTAREQSHRVSPPSLRLSFAPSTIRVVRVIQWVLSAVACAGLVLASWWWWDGHALDEAAKQYESAAVRTEEGTRQFAEQMQREQLTLTVQQIAAIKQDIAFINQLAEKRAFSWTQLLADLEDALPSGTSIGKIQLDFKDSTVKIDGTAIRLQDMNAFITSLQTRPAFSHPVLHHHKILAPAGKKGQIEVSAGSDAPSSGIEFSLTVIYRQAA